MHIFEPNLQCNIVVLDTPPGDNLAISFATSDVDDKLAAETQMIERESAHSFTEVNFRRSAENQIESGAIISLFC